MIVLGIETSCDDTSAAIIKDRMVLSNVICSQAFTHEKFGGVVPELASRDHIRKISQVTDMAIKKAGLSVGDIDGVSVTSRPGLIGALFVGVSFAKSFAYYNNIPFVGINHIAAHLYAVFLEHEVTFPFVGLTVSGGHTSLNYVSDFHKEEVMGKTVDDAAGEAFDKVAKVLGLGYPGGPQVEELAKKGDKLIEFPRPLINNRKAEDKFNFSFSGLKSAVLNHLLNNPDSFRADVAASFQEAVIDTLVRKLKLAVKEKNVKNVVVAGGVACNGALKERVYDVFKEYNVYIPSPKYCTDNAAMVAFMGSKFLEQKIAHGINLSASSRE